MSKWTPLGSASVLCALIVLAATAAGCTGDPNVRKTRFLESGNRYFAEGNYAAAIIEYRNAVEIDTTFGEARKRLAEAYVRNNDAPHAFEQIIRAADLLPNDVQLQLTAGTYLLAARKPDDALVRADKALTLEPNNIQAHLLRGNALAGLSSFDEALKAIEEAIRLDPDRGTMFTQLGLVELARGRKAEAQAALTRAVELAPGSAQAYLALGNFYWSAGNAPETEKAFLGALQVEPNNNFANRAMAALSLVTGRYREAEPYLVRLADAGDPNAVYALANYYIGSGRAKDAVSRLEADSKTLKNAPNVAQWLARAYAAAGDTSRAKAMVEQVLAANPRAVDAQLLKGQLLMNEGQRDEAFATVRAAVSAHQESAAAHFALAQIYASRGDSAAATEAYREVLKINPRIAAAKVAIARLELSRGNRDASIQAVQEVTRAQPKNLDARLLLVRSLIASKDVARAKSELTSLRAEYPSLSAVHVQSGMLALLTNDVSGARTSFAHAESLDPASIDLLTGWLALDFKTNDLSRAKARIEERLKQGPTPALLLLAARTYLSAKDQLAAERVLRQAIELDASVLAPYEVLGRLYVSQNKLDQARTEFEALAKRQSNPVSALTMSGIILMTQGQNDLAKKRFEDVLATDPRAVIAANNLAWLYADAGDNLDTALTLIQTAMAQAPDRAELIDTLGWVYYKKNLPELAIPLFESCVKKEPGRAMYHHHLGLAYLRAGRSKQARASLERALANNPDAATAEDVKRVIARIGRA